VAEGLTPEFPEGAVEAAFQAALDALLADVPPALPRQSMISAVSGGPDSMCLAVLASRYAVRQGLGHRAIIIDHGLRPGSAAEAARVRARLQRMGIPADVMSIDSPAPVTGIQNWARSARYARLLHAARQGRAVLLLGHHSDDQAETVMMRLLRGSGLAGLAAMRGMTCREGVALLRPMLGLDGALIRRFCATQGIGVETDPSNADRRFERVRLRQWLAAAPSVPTAITGGDLCRLADAAGRIDNRLLAGLRRAQLCPVPEAGGFARLSDAALRLPDRAALRLLAHGLAMLTAAAHPPTQVALARLLLRLRAGTASTLGGTRFTRDDGGWLITAEEGRRPLRLRVTAGASVVFGGVWRVTSPVDATVRRLGAAGSGRRAAWRECHGWTALPALARRSVPVLETLDGTLHYPHLFPCELSPGCAGEAVAEFLPHSLVPER